jgi:transcriptional regulator with XRE-family HTH domain
MVKDPNYIPSIPTLDKVAKYLGVSIEELYTNDDEAREPDEKERRARRAVS